MNLISVIVPVYKVEKYLDKCIESIVNQTYKNIEIILIDDGSPDDCPRICDDWAKKDGRIKVIHKENAGVSKARIDGIKCAAGDYIGFVDSDDIIDSDMYERLLTNAEKYNTDISHCGYLSDKNGDISYFYNTGNIVLQDNAKGLYDLLEGSRIEPGLCNKLFHKTLFHSLLHEKSVMDFSAKNNEDLLMNYYLFKNAKTSVFEDFCPYHYFVRENSASKGNVNVHKLYDPVVVGKIIFEDAENNKDICDIASALYITKLLYAATYFDSDNSDLKKCRKKTLEELRKHLRYFVFSKNSVSRKLQAIFAAFFPRIYSLIHKLYLNH